MADAQRAFKNSQMEGDGERVHVPDTFDDSNTDSDSFG